MIKKFKHYLISKIKNFFLVFNISLTRKRKTFDDIYKKEFKIKPVIFDIGANDGQSIERFKKIFPKSTIHSFEPIKECFQNLKKKYLYKKDIILNNIALGSKEKIEKFYVNTNSYTSSFYKINKRYNYLHNNDQQMQIEKIKVMTLDKYILKKKINKIDIVKIDTQGYELDILKGGIKNLKNKIKFIELEIIFVDYYKKKVNLSDINNIMIRNNYYLYNIENLAHNTKGQIEWCDLLYKNSKF